MVVSPGLSGTRVRVGPSSMGITLPITIGLPMGVTWPVTPPMTTVHVIGGVGGKRASPNKSADSGFSDSGDSEASPCPGGVRGNHVSRVYLSGREEEHYQSPSSLPTIKVSNQLIGNRKKKGGKRRSGDELSSRRSKGSSVVPTNTKSCNEEVGLELLLQEYKSGVASFSSLAGASNTCAEAKDTSSCNSSSSPPPPNKQSPSISRSASISPSTLPSPAFSNLSETSFQNFSETSSRNGDLSSGSSPTQAPLR